MDKVGLKAYLEETVDELVHKVSWPTWSELQSSGIIVMIASVLIAVAVLIMDVVFGINPGGIFGWNGVFGLFYGIDS
ncbi:MAG: preprotein translocase subunit SecE [Flavobacteriales bacterium]|nr:preprotein translocase subunit SecE [Flavobacteriales bacterium]